MPILGVGEDTASAVYVGETPVERIYVGEDLAWSSGPPPIEFIAAQSAAANTLTMPDHETGDLFLGFAFNRTNTTIPTGVSGWKWGSEASTSCAYLVACKVAASNSETFGTWTNATDVAVLVYRRSGPGAWVTPTWWSRAGSGSTLDYTELSSYGATMPLDPDNTTQFWARFSGHRSATNMTANTPASWVSRTHAGQVRALDTGKLSVTSPSSVGGNSQAVDTSDGWGTVNVQVKSWDGTGIVCMGADADAATSAFTMPFCAAGDLIIGGGIRTGNTPPGNPSGYTQLTGSGNNNLASRVSYKIATSSSEASPVFSDATRALVAVFRSSNGHWDTVGVGLSLYGNDALLDFDGGLGPVSLVDNQKTAFVRFGTSYYTNLNTSLSGWTRRAGWGATPSLALWTALKPTGDAEDVGANTLAVTSGPWRNTTLRIAYIPFPPIENTNKTDEAIPSGVSGCNVTLIGAGGAGNPGVSLGAGGTGGGGGARINQVFIPVEELGETYSVSRGLGGTGAGGASTFSSGSISLSAGGGAQGGAGGTASASGLSVTSYSGSAGSSAGLAGTNNANNAGAGGGGGGNYPGGAPSGKGGDSSTRTGAAGSYSVGGTPTAATAGNGGAGGSGGAYNYNGGTGGLYGGGGGGGGTPSGGGNGGHGYTLVQWVEAEEE